MAPWTRALTSFSRTGMTHSMRLLWPSAWVRASISSMSRRGTWPRSSTSEGFAMTNEEWARQALQATVRRALLAASQELVLLARLIR